MTDPEDTQPIAPVTLDAPAEPDPGQRYPHTYDLPDAFFPRFVAVCHEVQCAPCDLLAVIKNESDIRHDAHNPAGDASGLLQFMPQTLRNLGYLQGDAAFRQLSAVDQLPFVARYLRPYSGRLATATACYVATFLPALLDHADEPDYALVVRGGRLGWAYAPNIGFDRDRDGIIKVSELTYALTRAMLSPRYVEACARANAVG